MNFCPADFCYDLSNTRAHQREIFSTRHAGDDVGVGESVVLEVEAALTDEIDEMLVIVSVTVAQTRMSARG